MRISVLVAVMVLISCNVFADKLINDFLGANNKFIAGYMNIDANQPSDEEFVKLLEENQDNLFFNKHLINLWRERIKLLEKETGYNPIKAFQGFGLFVGLDKDRKPEGIIAVHHEGNISNVIELLKKEGFFKKVKEEVKGNLRIFNVKEKIPGKKLAFVIVDNKDMFICFGKNMEKFLNKAEYTKYLDFTKKLRNDRLAQFIISVPNEVKAMLENPEMLPPKLLPVAGILKGLKNLEFFAKEKTLRFSIEFTDKSFVDIVKGMVQTGKTIGKSMLQVKLAEIDAFNEKATVIQKLHPKKIFEEANLRWTAEFLEKFDFMYDETKVYYQIDDLKIKPEEIVVVTAITGVLAAIAIPNFQKARKVAREKAAKANLRVLESAIEMYDMDSESGINLPDGSLDDLIHKLIKDGYLSERFDISPMGKKYYWDAKEKCVILR